MRTAWATLAAQGKNQEEISIMNQPEFVDAPAKTYMSEQEFIAHMNELIPTPSAETNNNLLDLANSLWWEMKDDLYHAFSFVSRHFTPETLQSVYDLCGARRAGLLPWEIIGAAIYSQTGTPPEKISTDEMRAFVLLPEPETPARSAPWPPAQCGKTGRKRCFIPFTLGRSSLKSCWMRRWRGPVSPVQR